MSEDRDATVLGSGEPTYPFSAWVFAEGKFQDVKEGWALPADGSSANWQKVLAEAPPPVTEIFGSYGPGVPLGEIDVAYNPDVNVLTATVALYWTPVDQAFGYHVVEYRDGKIINRYDYQANQYTHTVEVIQGRSYEWRVHSKGDAGVLSRYVSKKLRVGTTEKRWKSAPGGEVLTVLAKDSGTYCRDASVREVVKGKSVRDKLSDKWCDSKKMSGAFPELDSGVVAQGVLNSRRLKNGDVVYERNAGPLQGVILYDMDRAKDAFFKRSGLPARARGKVVVESVSVTLNRIEEKAKMFKEEAYVSTGNQRRLRGETGIKQRNPVSKILVSDATGALPYLLSKEVAESLWKKDALLLYREDPSTVKPNDGNGTDIFKYFSGYCRFYGVNKDNPNRLAATFRLSWDWVERPAVLSVWSD